MKIGRKRNTVPRTRTRARRVTRLKHTRRDWQTGRLRREYRRDHERRIRDYELLLYAATTTPYAGEEDDERGKIWPETA